MVPSSPFSLFPRLFFFFFLFVLQYVVLLTENIKTIGKYVLHALDMQGELPWENKDTYIFYLEMLMGKPCPPRSGQ